MRKIVIPVIAILLLAACGEDATGPEEGQGGEMTYSVEGYSFTWQQDPESTDSLLITITAPTTGWVAVGFEPESFMNGANLIIGYFQSNTASIRDDYGTGQVTHDSDLNLGGSSDVRAISGSQSAGETTLTFKIPYNSGDQYDKALSEGQTYTFIFAYGADDADDFTSSHVWAKSASFEL
jgi:hypothetical protein